MSAGSTAVVMSRYRLDDLGWYQFEWLCQSLLKLHLGIGIESWGGSSDLGRDAYHRGALELAKGVQTPGPFLFQAKFVQGANATGASVDGPLKKAVGAECTSIKKRWASRSIGEIKNYVLITNAPLSKDLRKNITETIKQTVPHCEVFAWGAGDLDALLDQAPNIRQSFPQLLGIRDLENLLGNLLTKAIRERSNLAIDRAQELARVFVPVKTYNKALSVLYKHNFVVITGPPEMGKTAIARMIGLAKHSQGWDYYECRSPEDFFAALKKSRAERDAERHQVFVADDAFGSTEYRVELAQAWGSDLEHILNALDKRHWFIWTSRPAPLAFALSKMHLQGKAEMFPRNAEIFVDASELNLEDRGLILYRHAKAANLNPTETQAVKDSLWQLVNHAHFTPERIRRFVRTGLQELVSQSPKVTSGAIQAAVEAEIANPTEAMRKSLACLSDEHKLFLVALLDGPSGPREMNSAHSAYTRLFSPIKREAKFLATDLLDHFISIRSPGNKAKEYDWVHPSWRDLLIDELAADRSIRHTFLKQCSVEGLLLAVSAGGGSVGVRILPLLLDDQDWDILHQRVLDVIADADERGAIRLINAIRDAIAPPDDRTAQIRLTNLSLSAYKAYHQRIHSQVTVDPYQIKRLLNLSARVNQTPKIPKLLPSITALYPTVLEALKSGKDGLWTGLPEEADEYLDFLALLKELRSPDLQNLLVEQFPSFLVALNEFWEDQLEYIGEDSSEDALSSDVDLLEQYRTIAKNLSDLSPDYTKQISELDLKLKKRLEAIEEQLREKQVDEDDYEREADRDSFSLTDLFRDL